MDFLSTPSGVRAAIRARWRARCTTTCPSGRPASSFRRSVPWEIGGGDWQLSYLPALTKQCDGCAERVTEGKRPTCVQHCQAKCMEYGELGELAATMEAGSKKVLYVL